MCYEEARDLVILAWGMGNVLVLTFSNKWRSLAQISGSVGVGYKS